MNQAAEVFDLGFHMHQQDFVWYVTTRDGVFKWDNPNVDIEIDRTADSIVAKYREWSLHGIDK